MTQNHLNQAVNHILDSTLHVINAAHKSLVLLGLPDDGAWLLLAHEGAPCGILDRASEPGWEALVMEIRAKLGAMP